MSKGFANKPKYREIKVNGKHLRRDLVIEKYYNELDPKPDMSFEDFQDICRTPFRHLQQKLSSRVLYDIRYKYFGKFTPKPNQLVWLLHNTRERCNKGLIEQKSYNATVVMITDYISSNTELFERFKKTLKPWIEI